MQFQFTASLVLALATVTAYGRAIVPGNDVKAREAEPETVQEWLGGNNGIHKREEVQEWLGGTNGIHKREEVQEWLGGTNGIHKREEVQEWLGGTNGIH